MTFKSEAEEILIGMETGIMPHDLPEHIHATSTSLRIAEAVEVLHKAHLKAVREELENVDRVNLSVTSDYIIDRIAEIDKQLEDK